MPIPLIWRPLPGQLAVWLASSACVAFPRLPGAPIGLDLSRDVLNALLKPVNLTCLVSLAGRPLLDLLLQVLLVPAQYPFMLLHLLIVAHEIHLHLK